MWVPQCSASIILLRYRFHSYHIILQQALTDVAFAAREIIFPYKIGFFKTKDK